MALNHNFVETPELLEISYRWFEPYHKAGCVFFIVWDFLSISLYYNELIKMTAKGYNSPKTILFLCIFIMLVIIPSYWMIIYAVNKTIVRLTLSQVTVKNGPLPWFRKNLSFPVEKIKYIWVEDRFPDSEEDFSRDIKAVFKNGNQEILFLNIVNPRESNLIRTRINLWLVENISKKQKSLHAKT
ncbi:Uncharacterized protein dnl_52220 [Desulfonema limicola]|uniref:Uncharacterized protein n=1 Tax=Desulfonema limicola TaxID=45656 RepID=A0A975BCD3_9BACT|nr:hypothetical protein [Desulfonema limicola]QTA82837.1 Uncharacterized protein dnl_52220 [Desulfonema limicola]